MRAHGVIFLITHDDGSPEGAVFTSVCLCPSAVSTRYLKTDAARITKLDTGMLYNGVKKSKVKVKSRKTLPAWVFVLF